MFEKFLIFGASLAFLAVKLAQGNDSIPLPPRPSDKNFTKCFTCNSPSYCRSPKAITCNLTAANETHYELAKYYSNVVHVPNHTGFKCINIASGNSKYIIAAHISLAATEIRLKNSTIVAVKGCASTDLSLKILRPVNVSHTIYFSAECNRYLCNTAGTLSFTVFTLISASFSLLLLKLL